MFPFPFSFIAPVADIPVEQIANAEAMSFNGTDQYVESSYSSILNQSVYSFSFWINNDINTGTVVQGIITCDSATRGWLVFQRGANLEIDQAGVHGVDSVGFFNSTNKWIHVGITFDGTNTSVFRNGVLFNTYTSGGVLQSNNNNLIIGNNTFASGRYFNGKLDEVAIFNTALSAEKITQIYDATAVVGSVPQTANLFTGGLSSSLVYWNRMGDS
tara:strand:+ start:1786 stop:2430 length:645 start_codon:yes stop_codon:yes gene_type:complete